jgi:F0F1-type ATP synthase membrane subunit b/b'
MAHLNLAPDPAVVGVQVGLFLVNMAIVKKLYLEPYLRLRANRDSLTTGSHADAARLLFECDEIARKVQGSIEEAASSAASHREAVKATATQRRTDIIRAAEEKARGEVEAVATRVKNEVAEQRAFLPKCVSDLTTELFAATTTND